MSLLKFTNVSFSQKGRSIISNLSLSVGQGDFISIVGPSGSGKSTLLKLCSHLVSPTGGNITFKDKDITEYDPVELRRTIAYCFQTPSLFGDNVLENIDFPFAIRSVKFDAKKVNGLFSLFHMDTDYLKKDIHTLSGGEKQRIALIRSLLFEPEVLLLDEATSALDAANTEIVENVIAGLNKKGVSVLWITHDSEQSRKYANKVLVIEAGEIRSLEVIK